MIVADTNLVAYLLIEGEHSRLCRDVLVRDPQWILPSFWKLEFANVLGNYVKFENWPLREAQALWSRAQRLPFITEKNVDPGDCLGLIQSSKLSLYDALFVELARRLDCPLVTFDKACRKAAPKLALSADEFLAKR